MKIDGAKILRISFSYANIVKEQVAKYLHYLAFNIPYLFGSLSKFFSPLFYCMIQISFSRKLLV